MEKKLNTVVRNNMTGNEAYNCSAWKDTRTGKQMIEGTSFKTGKKVYWLASHCTITPRLCFRG